MIHLYLIMQVDLEGTLYTRRAFIEVAGKGIIVTGSWLLVESMGMMNGSFHDILSDGSLRCSIQCLWQFCVYQGRNAFKVSSLVCEF